MLANYPACEGRLLVHEGGYTNDPRDPGGPTNWGITIYDARKYAALYGWITGRTVTADDVRAMPKWFAQKVYKAKYWDAMRLDLLPSGLDDAIFDYEVNSGWGRAGKVLRRLLGLPDNDWHVTDEVLAAVAKRDPAALINALCDERMRFLRSLGTFDHFGAGWTRRVTEVRTFALALAAGKVATLPTPAEPVQKAGKGHVAPPPKTGRVKAGGATAGAAGAGLGHWLVDHPIVPAAIIVVVGAGTLVLVKRIEQKHQARQEAPTPGTTVVPLAA